MNTVTAIAPRRAEVGRAKIHFPEHDEWLTRAELDALTPSILIERLRALQPMIAAHALETEQLRRPVDSVWKALRKTGWVFGQCVEHNWDGVASPPGPARRVPCG